MGGYMKIQKVLNLFNAGIYIRLSREDGDKEESDSVGNQRKLLTEYVAKKKILSCMTYTLMMVIRGQISTGLISRE